MSVLIDCSKEPFSWATLQQNKGHHSTKVWHMLGTSRFARTLWTAPTLAGVSFCSHLCVLVAQNAVVETLIREEGPFQEYVFYTQQDLPHDMVKCREFIGDTPKNVRIWVSDKLGENCDSCRYRAQQGAIHFLKNCLRDAVLQHTIDSSTAEELQRADLRDAHDLRRLLCNKVFNETPDGYSTPLIVIGSIDDPNGSNHWVLGEAYLRYHDDYKILFMRLNKEHLAHGSHGTDWWTGANYNAAFWGGVIGHEVFHTLGRDHVNDHHAAFVYEYGRCLSGAELAKAIANRVFPQKAAGRAGGFGYSGSCALNAAPPSGQFTFIRGDATLDSRVDISDAVRILEFLFQEGNGPPCGHVVDANDDDKVDIADPVKILHFLFAGGTIPLPYPEAGNDPTPGRYWGECLYGS